MRMPLRTILLFLLPLLCVLVAMLSLGILSGGSITISGSVTDFQTGQAIPEAIITAQRIGFGIRDGNIVWDKKYFYNAKTDSLGGFTLKVPSSNILISTTHPEYIKINQWFDGKTKIKIKIRRRNSLYTPLPQGTLQVGFDHNRPYGWNFSREAITFNPEEADLFPLVNASSGQSDHISLQVSGRGGILFISKNQIGVDTNLLIYTNEAPEEGYTATTTIDLQAGEAGVYFVRTSDGQHYAKFEFNPASFATIGSLQNRKEGHWGLLLYYVYNPNGARNLEFE